METVVDIDPDINRTAQQLQIMQLMNDEDYEGEIEGSEEGRAATQLDENSGDGHARCAPHRPEGERGRRRRTCSFRSAAEVFGALVRSWRRR